MKKQKKQFGDSFIAYLMIGTICLAVSYSLCVYGKYAFVWILKFVMFLILVYSIRRIPLYFGKKF